MIVIKSSAALATLRAEGTHPAALLDLVEKRMRDVVQAFAEAGAQWDGDEHGGFVLLEAEDDVRDFRSIGLNPEDQGLLGAIWEVATWHPTVGSWEILVLYAGDTGWTFFVPDAAWLDPDLRAKLTAEADVEQPPADTPTDAHSPF